MTPNFAENFTFDPMIKFDKTGALGLQQAKPVSLQM
jgi:hypothetical protein